MHSALKLQLESLTHTRREKKKKKNIISNFLSLGCCKPEEGQMYKREVSNVFFRKRVDAEMGTRASTKQHN